MSEGQDITPFFLESTAKINQSENTGLYFGWGWLPTGWPPFVLTALGFRSGSTDPGYTSSFFLGFRRLGFMAWESWRFRIGAGGGFSIRFIW